MTRNRRKAARKRRQIMDGARTVFLSGGFDGASMNDIARVAGVSKGTLYVYFDSKEQLFEALIREDRKQQAERLVFPGEPGDARELLRGFGRRLIEMMTRPEMIAHVRVVIAATAKFPRLGPGLLRGRPVPRREQSGRATAQARGARRARFRVRRCRPRRATSSSTCARRACSTACCSAPSRRSRRRTSTHR